MTQEHKNNKVKASLGLFVLTAVIVGGAVLSRSKPIAPDTVVSNTTPSNNTTPTSISPALTQNGSTFKDGTYTATGSYDSPGGTEAIKVTLTLNSGTVVNSKVVAEAQDPTAFSYEASFIDGYKTFVVGKKIDSIHVSNVSGSSLTSQGFNNALKQIENQARA